jgi:hypothetical protein
MRGINIGMVMDVDRLAIRGQWKISQFCGFATLRLCGFALNSFRARGWGTATGNKAKRGPDAYGTSRPRPNRTCGLAATATAAISLYVLRPMPATGSFLAITGRILGGSLKRSPDISASSKLRTGTGPSLRRSTEKVKIVRTSPKAFVNGRSPHAREYTRQSAVAVINVLTRLKNSKEWSYAFH